MYKFEVHIECANRVKRQTPVTVVSRIKNRTSGTLTSVACAALILAGCATTPPADDKVAMAAFKEANDPYEPFNRVMFDLNLALDNAVLRPAASIYRSVLPEPVQNGVHNFLHNLRSPVIFGNDLLQGELSRASSTLARFAMNSTVGILGLYDFAADVGIKKHNEDFGQTLAVWKVEPGPYLVLPIFGPSNPRDGLGKVADVLIDPLTWLAPFEVQVARTVGAAVDARARNFDQINDLEKNSLDFYSAVRSLYRQRRADEIRNGVPISTNPVTVNRSAMPDYKLERAQTAASQDGK